MQVGKPGAIGVEREDCPTFRAAATGSGSIESVVVQNQCPLRARSVTAVEVVECRKTGAIGIDFEDRANLRAAAISRGTIQGVAREQESIGAGPVQVSDRRIRGETVQGREGLRGRAAGRRQGQSDYERLRD